MKSWRRAVFAVALLSFVDCGKEGAQPALTVPSASQTASASDWDREFESGAAAARIALAQTGDEIAKHWQVQHGRSPDAHAEERFLALLPDPRPNPFESADAPKNESHHGHFVGFSDWLIATLKRHVISEEQFVAEWKLSKGGNVDPTEIVETDTASDLVRRWIGDIAKPLENAVAAFELPIPFVNFEGRKLWNDPGVALALDVSNAIRCRAAIACVDRRPDASIAMLTSYLAFLSKLPILPRQGDFDVLAEEDHEALRLLTAIVRVKGCGEESIPRLREVVDCVPAAELRRRAVDFIRWEWLCAIARHSAHIDELIYHRPGTPELFASWLDSMGIRLELRDRAPLLFAEDELWQAVHAAFVEETEWRHAFERATRSIDSLVNEDSDSKPTGSRASLRLARRLAAVMWLDSFKMSLEGVDDCLLSPALRSFEDRCDLSVAMKLARSATGADTSRDEFPVDPVFGLPPIVELAHDHRVAGVAIDDQLREKKRLREQLSRDISRIQGALGPAFPSRGR